MHNPQAKEMLTSDFVFDDFQGIRREDQEKDPEDIANLQSFAIAKCRSNLKSRDDTWDQIRTLTFWMQQGSVRLGL